jgi:hypothetical protein
MTTSFRRNRRVAVVAVVALLGWHTASAAADNGPIRFRPVDVYVDSGTASLAAYQVEIVADGDALIVGVEGGDPPAFAPPPHYDPAALASGRIILAAFDTGADLPKGRTRVAIVHMRESGERLPHYRATLQIAGGPDGRPIDATVELVPDEGDR